MQVYEGDISEVTMTLGVDDGLNENTTKTETVDTEIENEQLNPYNNDKIIKLQEQIVNLNSDADTITTTALANAKTSDLTEHQEILIAAVTAIKEGTSEKPAEESKLMGILNSVGMKLPFVKRVKKSIDETFVENASLKENIDTVFEALEGSIKATESDLNTLSHLQDSLKQSVQLGRKLHNEIEEIISNFDEANESAFIKNKYMGLSRELSSINLVNSNTANQLEAQINTTSGLAQNMREVRPILKNLINSQALVALQNARMGQAKNVRNIVSEVVNDFITTNNQATNETILDAVEYSGKTIIKKETVDELGTQHTAFIKQLTTIATNLEKDKIAYTKSVSKVTAQLDKGLKELPNILSGNHIRQITE